MHAFTQWRDALLRAVQAAKLLRRAQRVELKPDLWALQGALTIAGREVTIALVVDPLFHNRLPIALLCPWDALGFIPHVDPSGVVCYEDAEGIILDQRQQLEVIRAALAGVRRTLEDGVRGANQAAFVDEFEVYWQRIPGGVVALSGVEPSNEVAEIVIATGSESQAQLRLAHDAHAIMHVASARQTAGPWTAQRAIYVPLEAHTILIPPRSDRPFWNVDDTRALLAFCSASNRARLMDMIACRAYATEYLILRLLRPAGGAALFGIRFEGVGERHPLLEDGHSAKLTPITILRRDRSFLVERGGGQIELENKKILLLGCGSVGGHLAHELTRAGIGRLTLVDHDTLEPENTYRHILGKLYWGHNKALALKRFLTAQLPFIEVQAIPEMLETALEQNLVRLHDYDLIVSALGNPTAELALNERVRGIESGPPVIFTWLEPFGLGGHAILTGYGGGPGCFECLYPAIDTPDDVMHNRASFAAPGQKYRRSIAGCSSLYTPYGALDATQTALLAVRLAIDTLLGRERQNVLRSWKGDATAFMAAVYELGSRYARDADDFQRLEARYPHPRCRVCAADR